MKTSERISSDHSPIVLGVSLVAGFGLTLMIIVLGVGLLYWVWALCRVPPPIPVRSQLVSFSVWSSSRWASSVGSLKFSLSGTLMTSTSPHRTIMDTVMTPMQSMHRMTVTLRLWHTTNHCAADHPPA